MTITHLAVNTLTNGSQHLYTIGVVVLVFLVLLGGGARTVGAFFGGRIGHAWGWAISAIALAVVIGSGYAIYVSTKNTVDETGITTGQFGQ
jgi:hypothetical protein